MRYNILLPVDGSKHSYHALDQAIFLGQCFPHAKVFVMHVVPLSYYVGEAGLASAGLNYDLDAEAAKQGNELLRAVGDKLQDAGIPYELMLKRGYPAKVISEAVDEQKCDIVVIGSRGLGSFGEFVLGSVSHKVLHEVNCPVLVVR